MANYAWEFGSEGSGLWFTITYNSDTNELTVSSLEGKFDFNALWFGDGDSKANEYGGTALSKSDSQLNMNGSGATWDGYIKFSNAGLGTAGEDKSTFISAGETQAFTLSGASLANFENALSSDNFQIGVRATSVNGSGSIKSVGEDIPLPTIDVTKAASPEFFDEGTPTDITYTYSVQNTSEHETFSEMTLVSLVDDNGTPSDTSDDVNLLLHFDSSGGTGHIVYGDYYLTGDSDSDGLLDVGESWSFSYTREGVEENAGWTSTNTVTAVGESKNLDVSDTATATVTAEDVKPDVAVTKVGSVSAIEDSGPVTFTYTVENTSTASTDPLTLVSLVDDNGTAGDTSDDINLLDGFVAGSSHGTHYTGGDTGNDYVLSQGEVWTFDYSTTLTVADGQSHINTVTVEASDDEDNSVTDTASWEIVNAPDGGGGGGGSPPEDDNFPTFGKSLSNAVFYLDRDGSSTTTNDIFKVKVDLAGSGLYDLDNADVGGKELTDWILDQYSGSKLLAVSIHAGNNDIVTNILNVDSNPASPNLNQEQELQLIRPNEGQLYLWGDSDPKDSDYNPPLHSSVQTFDSTPPLASPVYEDGKDYSVTAEMQLLGLTHDVLMAGYDATWNYNNGSPV